jgi:hypothetical protein
MEQAIDLVKLKLIDSIRSKNLFHIDYLIAYYLELIILERQSSFNQFLGEKILQDMVRFY